MAIAKEDSAKNIGGSGSLSDGAPFAIISDIGSQFVISRHNRIGVEEFQLGRGADKLRAGFGAFPF